MKKHLITALAIALPAVFAGAQTHKHVCGADEHYHELVKKDPSIRAKEIEANRLAAEAMKSGAPKKAAGKKIIPVVFHVFHTGTNDNITKAQILNEIQILNRNFNGYDTSNIRPLYRGIAADMELEFRLATKDPNGNCTDGIVRVYDIENENGTNNIKLKSVWPTDRYLNIWVVDNIVNFSSGLPGIAAYAQFPWAGQHATDGVISRNDQIGSIGTSRPSNASTITHEIGHWIGLFHTFQGGCNNEDQVDDTPACETRTSILSCDYNRNTCGQGDTADLPDQIENYMDYIEGTCQSMFTEGQKARGHFMLENWRKVLWSQENLERTGVADPYNYATQSGACAPVASFYARPAIGTFVTQFPSACEGRVVNFVNNSYNVDLAGVTFNWEFEGGTPATHTGTTPPAINYAAPGVYDVKLTATNANGENIFTANDYVTVDPNTAVLKAPWFEDIEFKDFPYYGWSVNSTSFDNWQRVALSTTSSISGQHAMTIFNSAGNAGARYQLISPSFDLSNIANPVISFMYAFAQRVGAGGQGTNDQLIVYTSEDCGQTWRNQWNRSGNALQTTGASSAPVSGLPFVPASTASWRLVSQGLNLTNKSNVRFRFEFRSAGGNNIYLDAINVGFTLVNNNAFENSANFNVYPNPASSFATVSLNLTEASEVSIKLMDINGKEIKNIQNPSTLEIGSHEFKFDTGLSSGVYMVNLTVNGNTYTRKLVIAQ